ncbi:MAG: DUF5115 domain-containing protein [Bacteroidales bacterium]|nr:DUF5115 domain-containing protein [Bacteroidales bacterium]
MKKIGLMLMAVLSLGFVACEDDTKAIPQSNAQEATMSANGLTVAYGSDLAGESIDLATLVANGGAVNVITTEAVENLPAGAAVEYTMQISANEDYSNATSFVVENGAVSATEWDNWFRGTIGKAPNAKNNYVRFAAYVAEGTSKVRLGGPDTWFAAKAISVTPIALDITIEEAYYLLGTINGWSVAEAIKFNHSEANVYDDPIFTLNFEISEEEAAAGWWWKIVPQSTYETGNWVNAKNASYGVENDGDTATEGILFGRPNESQDCGAGCLKISGQLRLTIDMLNGTYAFTSAVTNLWTPGNANGWSHADSQMLYTYDFENYMGFAHLDGEFKFTNAADWNHTNYGFAEEGKISTDGDNINAGGNGLFWCQVNTTELTYSLYLAETLGVIGDATSGAWDNSTALTPSADFLVWTGDVEFKAGGEWKLRANNAWDVNLGGDMNNLSKDGSNIATPGEGVYTVTLDLSKLPYTVSVAKK